MRGFPGETYVLPLSRLQLQISAELDATQSIQQGFVSRDRGADLESMRRRDLGDA